jgi:hypothetical protein
VGGVVARLTNDRVIRRLNIREMNCIKENDLRGLTAQVALMIAPTLQLALLERISSSRISPSVEILSRDSDRGW